MTLLLGITIKLLTLLLLISELNLIRHLRCEFQAHETNKPYSNVDSQSFKVIFSDMSRPRGADRLLP